MSGVQLVEASVNRGLEVGVIRMVTRVQGLFLDELPKPLDQIEVGGVRGQKQQLDVQLLRHVSDKLAPLIRGVIEYQRDRCSHAQGGDLVQQLTDRVTIDVSLIADADQFLRERVHGSQNIVSLAARSAANEQPCRTPDPAQK